MKRHLVVVSVIVLVSLLAIIGGACTRPRAEAAVIPAAIDYQLAFNTGAAQKAAAMQGGTSVIISPASTAIDIGTTTTVEVQVQNVTGLYGVDIRLSFDPAKLEVVDANPGVAGVQIEPGPFLDVNQGFVAQNSADNAAGRINYAMTLLNPASPVDGSGTLMRITFRAKAEGESVISFLSALLSDRPGMQIPATTVPGTITVNPAVAPTSTPLPPTETPAAPTPVPTTQPTPSAPTPTPVPSTGRVCKYTVRRGDTLYGIARRYGTTVSAIASYNGIRNPNFIWVGQRLLIPNCITPPPPPPPPSGCFTYTVRRGDTLSGIAARYGTTTWRLVNLNRIRNPNIIYVGQRLTVCRGRAAPPAGRFYRVQPGDTLIGIAFRFGTTVRAIQLANGIVNPNLIYVGQVLRIP